VPESDHARFAVDKVAQGQVFLRVLPFPLSVSFHRGSPYPYIIWRMNNRPAGGRSSETWSQPIDMSKVKLDKAGDRRPTRPLVSTYLRGLYNECKLYVSYTPQT
jgi:hypothetical protein